MLNVAGWWDQEDFYAVPSKSTNFWRSMIPRTRIFWLLTVESRQMVERRGPETRTGRFRQRYGRTLPEGHHDAVPYILSERESSLDLPEALTFQDRRKRVGAARCLAA